VQHPVELVLDIALKLRPYQALGRRQHVVHFRPAGAGGIKETPSFHAPKYRLFFGILKEKAEEELIRTADVLGSPGSLFVMVRGVAVLINSQG
jgi:hypothetical protein